MVQYKEADHVYESNGEAWHTATSSPSASCSIADIPANVAMVYLADTGTVNVSGVNDEEVVIGAHEGNRSRRHINTHHRHDGTQSLIPASRLMT